MIKTITTKLKRQKEKLCEYGRGMVEMLGVLAIVGLLSVGGLTGYTKAMRYIRISNIKQAVAMYIIKLNEENEIVRHCNAHKTCQLEASWSNLFPDTPLPELTIGMGTDFLTPMPWCYGNKLIISQEVWVEFEHNEGGIEFCREFCKSFHSPPNENQNGENTGQLTCWDQCENNTSRNIASYSACVYIPIGEIPHNADWSCGN